jgi:hypothetical protein
VIKFVSDKRHVSSTNKTDSHNITEILLKVALNTINNKRFISMSNIFSINQLTLILKIIDQYDVIDYIMTSIAARLIRLDVFK